MAKRSKGQNTKGQKRFNLSKRSNKTFSSKKTSAIDKISKAPTNPNRVMKEGKNSFYRTKAKINLLNLYNSKPNKDRFKVPNKPVRIEPDRRWFGNVRTIDQKKLEQMNKEYEKILNNKKKDTFSIFLNQSKIPQSLIKPLNNESKINNKISSFEETFGKKSKRTKPNLNVYTLEEYVDNSLKKVENYNTEKDKDLNNINEIEKIAPEFKYMKAGQSKRIYSELLKVIDSSDVLVEVLDSRDPIGTKCSYVENFIEKNCPHKHIIYLINKVDLVPTWVTAAYVKHLSKIYPCIAFHASITNPYGKPALFQLLRQFDALHKDKKNISVGFIGYPNVGKSSVINTLKKQKSCRVAPIPGETKVWQYVALTKRIYLIDCPGVVYEEGQTQLDRVLKNVVRAEKIEEPMEFIHGILARCEEKYLKQIYKINSWKDDEDFVGQCAKNYGKLLRGGEPDLKATAKIILNDWQRGKIPYFIPPPKDTEFEEFDKNNNNNIDKNNDKMDVENIKGIAIQEDVKNDDQNKKYGIEQNINEIDTKDFNKEDNLNEE